ncbi:hypothetical protein JCM4914_04790 [Streptomyces platensis subsp. malvinus]
MGPGTGTAVGRHARLHGLTREADATNDGGDAMKKAYEAPTLVRLGTFRKKTGLLNSSGNDRLVLSKN